MGLSLFVSLVCMTGAGHGQDKITWKVFEKDAKPFYQTVETDTTQELKVQEMTFKQQQKQTFLMEWTPKGEKDGNITVEQRIVGVKMKLDIGGNKIEYDTTDESTAKNPMTQFFKALEKAKFTLTIDAKDHKVKKVEGLKELVEDLTKVNKSFEPVLKQILSEETVKTLAEPVFGMLPPDGAIPKDNKWEGKETVLSMGPLGKYTTVNKYTVDPEEKKDLKVKVETTLTYQPPEGGADKGGLPFTIKGGKLTTQKSSGTILFNKEKGRIDSSDLHVELSGNLKVSISSTETDVALYQKQDVKVRTFDTSKDLPDNWKKLFKDKSK